MANDEHLAKLNEGVHVWNTWREKNLNVSPDLARAFLIRANFTGADFNGANLTGAILFEASLTGANLNGANLSGADLSGANLHGADLGGAKLSWAKLNGADLGGAKLGGAHLGGANLIGANLSRGSLFRADLAGTNLTRANLTGADLTGADLTGANLLQAKLDGAQFDASICDGAQLKRASCVGTQFHDMDLSACLGLREVANWSDVDIDADTVLRSKRALPVAMLQASDLPDHVLKAVEPGDLIEIEFRRSVWGPLFPIEQALTATLGKHYAVKKDKDRIVIVLDSSEQFQDALNAVLSVLTGLEAVSPGEVVRLRAEPREGRSEEVRDAELLELLRRLARLYEEDHPRFSDAEEFAIELTKAFPVIGGTLALASEKALVAAGRPRTRFEDLALSTRIYRSFKGFFAGAKPITELQAAHISEPELLETGERSDDSE